MERAIAQLELAADVAETNEPINREAGNTKQADVERETAAQCRAAALILSAAECGVAVDLTKSPRV